MFRRPASSLYHDTHLIADLCRIDVLIALGHLGHGCDVDPALVHERAAAHVRLVRIRVEVRDRGDEVGRVGQARQLLGRDHVVSQLELEGGDEGDEIEVAAAFPVAVNRPLDVDAAGTHRRQRIRERQAGVVVRVDAEGRGDHGAGLADPFLDHLG